MGKEAPIIAKRKKAGVAMSIKSVVFKVKIMKNKESHYKNGENFYQKKKNSKI